MFLNISYVGRRIIWDPINHSGFVSPMNASQISATYIAFLDIVRKNARNGDLQWRRIQLLITPIELGHELVILKIMVALFVIDN